MGIEQGIYQHFRNGKEYELLGMAVQSVSTEDAEFVALALHTESKEVYDIFLREGRYYIHALEEMGTPFVFYRGLYDCEELGLHPYFIRPIAMWDEIVEHNGKEVVRFEFLRHE